MKTEKIVNVEDVVKNLFATFPYVKYIALNPGVSEDNEYCWTNQWYFVGYEYEPAYTVVDGWWCWAYDITVATSDEEIGNFFLNMRSDVLRYRGEPIQTDKYEFINVGELCWHMKDDGEIEQIIKERTDLDDIKTAEEIFDAEEKIKKKQTIDDALKEAIENKGFTIQRNNSLSQYL